jgi:hypothetical protein
MVHRRRRPSTRRPRGHGRRARGWWRRSLAVAALVVAYRKQRVGERDHDLAKQIAGDNTHDAIQRRVTELDGQAVEQLGHDKAAIRIGGPHCGPRHAPDTHALPGLAPAPR